MEETYCGKNLPLFFFGDIPVGVIPCVAPRGFARKPVSLLVRSRYCSSFRMAIRHTQFKLNMATVLAGMAKDARRHCFRRLAAGYEIREFFIFITQSPALELAMPGSTLNALSKVAPVACGSHGAGMLMRTWRQNFCAAGDQGCARGIYAGKSARSSWFDDDQKFCGAGPRLADDSFRRYRAEFAQGVREHYQIMRITRKT